MLCSLPPDLHALALIVLLGVLAIAGLVSGLSGFGFSGVGAATLFLLPAAQSVPLLMALSTVDQILSLCQLSSERGPLARGWPAETGPLLLGGAFGLPVGLWLLQHLAQCSLMLLSGALLIGFALFSLFRPAHWRVEAGGWGRRALVGMAGGTMGGFTAFPGAAVVVWLNLAGVPKVAARTTAQPFILGMQVLGLAALAVSRSEAFGSEFRGLFSLSLPVVLPCTAAGVAIYRRLSDRNFRRVTLALLGAAGLGLLGRALAG